LIESNGNGSGTFQKYVQAVVQVVITALLLWIGITTLNTSRDIGTLSVKLEERSTQTSKDISDLKAEIITLKTQINNVAISAAGSRR
jgi:cell division protein FtsB